MIGHPRRVDRGETSAEVVLAVPTIFLVVLFAIQLAMYAHTATVASVAATTGAAAAAGLDGGSARGVETARSTAHDLSGRLLGMPIVELGDEDVAVTVALAVPRVVPFMDLVVSRTATEPRERFVTEDRR